MLEIVSEGVIEILIRRAVRRGGGVDVGGAAFAIFNVVCFGVFDCDDVLVCLLDDDDDGLSV